MIHVVVHVCRKLFPSNFIVLVDIKLSITQHEIILEMFFPYRMIHFLEVGHSILNHIIFVVKVQQG